MKEGFFMHYGFIKVAAGSPKVSVADTDANASAIRSMIERAHAVGANLLVLPELCDGLSHCDVVNHIFRLLQSVC